MLLNLLYLSYLIDQKLTHFLVSENTWQIAIRCNFFLRRKKEGKRVHNYRTTSFCFDGKFTRRNHFHRPPIFPKVSPKGGIDLSVDPISVPAQHLLEFHAQIKTYGKREKRILSIVLGWVLSKSFYQLSLKNQIH